jgi:aminopeptidase N
VFCRAASDHQLAWAQLLGWTATSADQLDLIAVLLDGSAGVPGLPVGAELRWSLLRRLAATGRAGDASIDAELAADPTDAGARQAAACRAAIADAQHKEAAWELLTSVGVGPETLSAIARGFIQPEQATLLVPYAGRYLAEMPAIWATRDGHLRVQLGEQLFPYGGLAGAGLADR